MSSARKLLHGQRSHRLDVELCLETSSSTLNMAVRSGHSVFRRPQVHLERPKTILPDMFRGLPQSLQEYNGKEPQIKRQRLPSTFFSNHYSLITRWCSSEYSELLKTSLNKPGTYWGTSTGKTMVYRDNIKMDNRELNCENGNSTTLHVAQRTKKFKVVHNMRR